MKWVNAMSDAAQMIQFKAFRNFSYVVSVGKSVSINSFSKIGEHAIPSWEFTSGPLPARSSAVRAGVGYFVFCFEALDSVHVYNYTT